MADFHNKYGLTDLDEVDIKILEQIMLDLAGTGGIFGTTFYPRIQGCRNANGKCLVDAYQAELAYFKTIAEVKQEINNSLAGAAWKIADTPG